MWLDWILNPGPLGLVSDALTTALCGPVDPSVSSKATLFSTLGQLSTRWSKQSGKIFLTYGIEFVLILAVLENSVLPMG